MNKMWGSIDNWKHFDFTIIPCKFQFTNMKNNEQVISSDLFPE